MALNANEINYLISELDFNDTFIQDIVEHDFHSFTMCLFSKQEKAWLLYVEIGTPYQRICKTNRIRKKSTKMQRFTQYLRANIVGSRIVDVKVTKGEREVVFTLKHADVEKKMFIRLFSGPSSNIIITDQNLMILEVLMRRPKRGEEKGKLFTPSQEKEIDEVKFPIRSFTANTFNEEIDKNISAEKTDELLDKLKNQVILKRDEELTYLKGQLRDKEKKVEEFKSYEELKASADLLSAYSYLIKKGQDKVNLTDFEGNSVTILIDSSLSASQNINAYYQKYKRAQRIYENNINDINEIKEAILEKEKHYEELLSQNSINLFEKEIGEQSGSKKNNESGPGLKLTSHGFDILVGRNSKENDELLRHHVRGNDLWLHTRDTAGGYVFIKCKKDKSVPLDVLIDAGNLAVHYSKAKANKKASLYYTHVKYLRRVKDGKQGLVIPTQEKNLDITLDEKRVKQLLSKEGGLF